MLVMAGLGERFLHAEDDVLDDPADAQSAAHGGLTGLVVIESVGATATTATTTGKT